MSDFPDPNAEFFKVPGGTEADAANPSEFRAFDLPMLSSQFTIEIDHMDKTMQS